MVSTLTLNSTAPLRADAYPSFWFQFTHAVAATFVDAPNFAPTVGGLITAPAIPRVGAAARQVIERVLDLPQHTLAQSAFFHLLPGLLMASVVPFVLPRVAANGYIPLIGLLLIFLTAACPWMLSMLVRESYGRNRDYSLRGVVYFREAIPTWKYFVFAPLLAAWAGLVMHLLRPLDNWLLSNLFAWVPGWAQIGNTAALAGAGAEERFLSLLLALVAGGAVLPVLEELYFRGYLLPRMERFGSWAPVLNTTLFALYGLFAPWQFLSRLAAFFPLIYLSWREQNIRLAIAARILLGVASVWMIFA